MPTRAEIDQIFLAKHNPLTERCYAMKRAGQITPALQVLFDKAHSFLTLAHERGIRLLGPEAEARGEGDYYVDEVRDEEGNLASPGTKFRSQEIAEALAGSFKLRVVEIAEILTRWGVSLE